MTNKGNQAVLQKLSPRLRELRLVAPVVAAVCIILIAAIYFETYLERLRSRGGRNQWGVWLLWSQYLILSTSAAGIWMAAVWSSLYGKKTLVRLAAAVFTVAVVTTLGWKTAILLDDGVFFKRDFEALGSLVAAGGAFFVICVFPLLAMRWLRAWGILHEEDASAMPDSRSYSLKNIFYLTTAAAVSCAVFVWVADSLRISNSGKVIVYFIVNILPSIGGLLLLKAMSRMRIRFLWPIACMLGLCVAGATTFGLRFSTDWKLSWQRAIDEAFMPTLVGFLYAAFLALLAALWLRNQGVLFRCGGSSGFGAIRDKTVPFSRRAVAVAVTCALLAGISIGGWKYYPHWVLMHSAIPSQPTVADLPRLMSVACHFSTQYDSQETQNKINERCRQATEAIVGLGDQAIPFLLERLTEAVTDQRGTIPPTAGDLLTRIGQQNSFGTYKERVLATVTGNEQAFSNGWFALLILDADAVPTLVELLEEHDYRTAYSALVLARIGLPHAAPAIPALKRACLAEWPDVTRFHLNPVLSALVKLAGTDALATLLKVLEDKQNYSLKQRVHAASAVGLLGSEGAGAVPMIGDLLEEVTDTVRRTASKNKYWPGNYEIEDLQIRVIESIASVGPAAKSVAPQLLQIMESTEAESRLRPSVVKALGRLQVVEAIPELELIVQEEAPQSDIQEAAVIALGDIGPPAGNAIDTIEEYVAASGRWIVDSRLIAAEVAKARILMAQRESLTRSLLNWFSQPVDAPGSEADVVPEDTSQQVAILCALIWLGAAEDAQAMRYQAQVRLNGAEHKVSLDSTADPALSKLPMSRVLEGIFGGQYDDYASFDDRWTTDGKVRSLLNSLEIGLQADDPTTRLAASDLLAAMGPLSLPVAPALHACLKDEDPRVRLRAAIALMLAGEVSEEVDRALRDQAEPDWAGMPLPLRQLVEARIAEPVSK